MAKTTRAFRVDARALISLGRESIKDHTTALIELVKNAYDADAENVEVEISDKGNKSDRYIRIADDGIGMTSADIDEKFLRIGFSEKRKKRVSAKGRRETGEKGIGRLSADRLGAVMELRSKSAGHKPVGIRVAWDDFDTDGVEIGSVNVAELSNPQPLMAKRDHAKNFSASGTEILIRELRQDWTSEDLSYLETELATLVPGQVAKSDFQIWLSSDQSNGFNPVVSAFDVAAELEFHGDFDSDGRLVYRVTAPPLKSGQKRHDVKAGSLPWDQLVTSDPPLEYDLGKIRILLSFFPRKAANLSGHFSLKQLRNYLDTQGGVKIYRDGIRVKPYGDPNHPEGDWLGLSERKSRNPAGAGRRDFRIASNQLVGIVEIGRDSNPKLADSAAREGLIHGAAFACLKAAVFGCVQLLETFYHERFLTSRREESASGEKLPVVLGQIKTSLGSLQKSLSDAEKETGGRESARLRSTVEQIAAVAQKFAHAEREIEELANQATVYRGLATVGISTAVFAHETESALAQAKASASLALKSLSGSTPNVELSKGELVKVGKAIGKVAVWGQFAISRVKKDKRKRSKFDVSRVVLGIIDELRPLYESAGIVLERKVQPGLELRAFVMDIESIVLNLLTNAYHHALPSKKKKVAVSLVSVGARASREIELSVSDSGAGITKEHLPQIWTPLFSTKVDKKGRSIGTGLGLSIVKSVVDEMGASITASPRSALGGAAFRIRFQIA